MESTQKVVTQFDSHFSIDELQHQWEKLSIQTKPNVYLDWRWIKTWLTVFATKPLLLRCQLNDETIGLALFDQTSSRVFKCQNIQQLWLHRCGNEQADQIWIEQNDFLLSQAHRSLALNSMLQVLDSRSDMWHEIYVGLSDEQTLQPWLAVFPHYRCDVSAMSYLADLQSIDNIDTYKAQLSKNTRAQINRSIKLLSQHGKINLELAGDLDSKKRYFADMASLHKRRWGNTEFGSGFDNPLFTLFHQELIYNDLDNSFTHLYRLSLEQTTLGYVYLLLDGHGWNFYLSALELHNDNKIKVGMVVHIMLIEKAIIAGQKYYNFLAGDAQYKQSLSNTLATSEQLLCFYRPTVLLRLREKLRQLKHVITRSS
jgi:CelD/BcsL family acetyltransferase involved in cellulose biosynthesis